MIYKLSDPPISGDMVSKNISRKRIKLYDGIKKFAKQRGNDGIFAENIMRLVFDGINLNHFHKNHPYVDIGIINEIPGIVQRDEILSVKSTINYVSTSKLLTDSKAVKIESLFSYVLFAHYNFELEYVETLNSPTTLLKKAIDLASSKVYQNVDYKKIVQITTFYMMFHNEPKIDDKFLSDIRIILTGGNNLKYGTYEYYDTSVSKNLERLQIPISIGICYIVPDTKEKKDTICVIEKTNPIPLNTYWSRLLDIWCTREYFGKGVTKYLKYDDICSIYGIEKSENSRKKKFPIEIKIHTWDFEDGRNYNDLTPLEREKIIKDRQEKKSKRLYVATKFKDANFEDEDKIVSTFNDLIDVLEEKPKLVTKFEDFIKQQK